VVEQAGGAAVVQQGRAAGVAAAPPVPRLVHAGLGRPVLLCVQPVRRVGLPAWGGGRVLVGLWGRGGLLLGLLLLLPPFDSGIGVALCRIAVVLVVVARLVVVRGVAVGVSVSRLRVDLLQRVVVGARRRGDRRHAGRRGFGKQPSFVAAVFDGQALTSPHRALLGLAVGAMTVVVEVVVGVVAAGHGPRRVAVLGPRARGQWVQGVLGVAHPAALLQGLVDGQGGLLERHTALVGVGDGSGRIPALASLPLLH